MPLVAAELPRAMLHLPIAFLREGGAVIPVAVLSPQPGRNLFVAPDGRWIGGYVPAALRGHPFRLLPTDDGRHALCVDEDSGLVTEGPAGEPFFDPDGQLSVPLRQVLDFLSAIEANRAATARACAALLHHGVVAPWPITLRTEAGEQPVEGLLRIDEAALNALPMPAFEELRQAGAVPVAYCQMLSAQHLPLLGRLAAAHAQQQARAAPLERILTPPAEQELELDWTLLDVRGTA